MPKPKSQTATVSTWTLGLPLTRDIVEYARRYMDIELLPGQIAIIDALAQGKKVWFGRRHGYNTAVKVLYTYVQESGGFIKHFKKTHFRGETAEGHKFVYCPVGNICSWSPGDHDFQYCEWCKKFYDEIRDNKETIQ